MIMDLKRFVAGERPCWAEFEAVLKRLDADPALRLTLPEVKRFHYLYERTAADLAKVVTFASEPGLKRYLETIVANAYEEVHETRSRHSPLVPWRWFARDFPHAVRRNGVALALSAAIMLLGCTFGAAAIAFDPAARDMLLPAPHRAVSPSERVAREEGTTTDRLRNLKASFSAFLVQNNVKVSILALGLGMTFGVGTAALLFFNGAMLGAVAMEYVRAGQAAFLAGWLLPHGVVELPAIVIAGQAGLILGGALIGRGRRDRLGERLRAVARDIVILVFGVAVLLLWAAAVESFFSQYHEPLVPYGVKIAFGAAELALLFLFLARSGARTAAGEGRG
ncbi:MAG: stage II sporulation protein M [Deltaproteobacteria bacterium]|nr:stage II sporulation protein M [Deltaproteobacteria bacterium]